MLNVCGKARDKYIEMKEIEILCYCAFCAYLNEHLFLFVILNENSNQIPNSIQPNKWNQTQRRPTNFSYISSSVSLIFMYYMFKILFCAWKDLNFGIRQNQR